MPKIMEIIEKETKGKSYHTYKYSYDSIDLPSIDYDDDPNKVMKWKDWPLGEFCVSVFRQNQEYHIFNVHDGGLFPLVNFLPAGWDGMRAAGGVNAGSLCREYYFKGISLPCGRRT